MRVSDLLYLVLAGVTAPVRGAQHAVSQRRSKRQRKRPTIHLSIESAEGQLIYPEHLPRPDRPQTSRTGRHSGRRR
jgi:hypothetical protein